MNNNLKAGETTTVVVKKWYTSKTLWFNVVTFLLEIINLATKSPLFVNYTTYLTVANLVGNAVLRFLTGQPVSFN